MAQHPAAANDGKLLGIQAARGAAALLVVAYHGERALSLPQYVGGPTLGGITGFGHAGVDFFFVLSGFIILAVHGRDLGQPGRFAHYAGRRVSRIYPPYWAAAAIVLALAYAGHGREGLPDLAGGALSLLLMPHGAENFVGVAWTLEREMVFYVLFGLAVLNQRLALAVVAVWGGLSCVAIVLPGSGIQLGPYALGTYDLLFVIGMAAAKALQRSTPARSGLIALAGVAAFLAAGVTEDLGMLPHEALVSRMAYGLASGVIILGLVGLERQGRLRVGRAMVLLGTASYSIYLVHLIPLNLTARALSVAGVVKVVPGWLVMALACAAAVIGGLVFHLLVERPLTRAAQRLALRLLTPGHGASRAALLPAAPAALLHTPDSDHTA